MPRELDLDVIKARNERAVRHVAVCAPDGVRDPDHCARAAYIGTVNDLPALVAEVERLQRLLGEPFPSSDAYEDVVQALTDERAEVVRLCDLLLERSKEREDLRGLLAEILRCFPSPPYRDVEVRSGRVREETLDRWRSRLGGVS